MAKRAPSGGRRAARRELIESLLAERAATGETYRSLSERSGISAKTLQRWQSRLRAETDRTTSVELVEIEPPGWPAGPSSTVEVILSTGMTVRIPPHVDVNWASALIAALGSARC